MGIVSTRLSQSNNMKFLLVLAVAAYARAEAEAKPGFVYTVGHHAPLVYGYPYAYHHPVVYTAPVGCQNNEGAAVPCAHGVLPYGLVPAAPPAAAEDDAEAAVSVEKREAEPTAEADAEADPLAVLSRSWLCCSSLWLWVLRTRAGLRWLRPPPRLLRPPPRLLRTPGILRQEGG